NHNSRLTIIPTAIDTEKYSIGIPEQSPGLVIGWSGSSSTNTFVNQLIPVLNRLAETHRFTFHVISNDVRNIRTGEMKGFEFRFFEWNDRTEVENLKKIHVGVMPLKDDPWARGKCALKALQYMALALPTVVSPVGVNTNIIQDGVNGFLAGPPNEWYGKLKCLLDSSELRQRVGRAARATVEKGYSLQVNFSLFRKVLENPESSANPKRPLETAGRS
ncbi:MAG TPA: glycosyltransferase family 4 protein, partial [bacterium]|nr:glycosyltransferase family 4 protein [bacterium]